MVESMDPVMICGSDSWHLTDAIVPVCPVSAWICALVRISQTRAVASRPAVTSTSRVGCRLKGARRAQGQYEPTGRH